MGVKVTQWVTWFFVFVQEKKLDTANLLAAEWDPDDGSTTFGTVRLSADGQEPVEYYACSTPATVTMRNGITTALGSVPWAEMYLTQDVTVEVPHWEGPDGWEFDGGIYAAWLAALADMGLQRISSPDVLVAGTVASPEAVERVEGIVKKGLRRLGKYRG